MDNNSVIQEVKHDDHCLIGYLGAFLGGIVGALPWMLLYLYSETDFVFLVALIPICALKGYQFFKGIVNKKTSATIAIISVVVLLFSQIIVFPELYGNKYDMNLKEFYESIHGSKYIDERIEELSSSIMLVLFGFVFAANEISKILRKYNATNQMIKDTGTISLKNQSPIKGADYNSAIKESSNKLESKIRIDEWDKTRDFIVTNPKSSRLANALKTNDNNTTKTSTYKSTNYNRLDNRAPSINKKSVKVMFIIFVILFIMPFFLIFFIADNLGNINTNLGYTYHFTNYDIKMNIPENWELSDTNTDNMIVVNDENDEESYFYIFEKNYFLDLNDFQNLISIYISESFGTESNETNRQLNLGTNLVYLSYSDIMSDENENIRLFTYCIETENYYISYISSTSLSYDVNTYTEYIEEILSTIDDYGYSSNNDDYDNYDNYDYDYDYDYDYNNDYNYDYDYNYNYNYDYNAY